MSKESNNTSDLVQHLTFILAGEEYGINILKVRGVQGWESPTPIPNAPAYALGVINLRGEVVPIIDLRKRFNVESIEYDNRTVVIIVRMESATGDRTVGLVVDAVSEVYKIDPTQLRQAPDFGTHIDNDYIKGLALVDDKMVILLDIDHLVNWGLLDLTRAQAQVVDSEEDVLAEASVA